MSQITPAAAVPQSPESWTADHQRQADQAERVRLAADTFFRRSGLTGGSQFSLAYLGRGPRRASRRRTPLGSARAYAEALREALDRRAAQRRERAVKGQRRPTPRQAVAIAAEIEAVVQSAQVRARERRITAQAVIQCARVAAAEGEHLVDGGRVTARSYGYRWETTTCRCALDASGVVRAEICRSGTSSISLPAKHWRSITLDTSTLAGGGVVGIRRDHGWDCYDSAAALVGVAIAMPSDLSNRWGRWEHGATVAEAQAEIERKRAILRTEAEEAAARKLSELAAAKQQARIDRAARLLARIGIRTEVGYDDARACGACDAGLRTFAAKLGLPIDTRLPLAEVAKIEPGWALKLARRIVAAKPQFAGAV